MRHGAAAFALALAALAAAPAAAGVVRIAAKNIGFVPAKITAKVGDMVEWMNGDFVVHTATARNRDWDVTLPAGKSGRVMLKRAGKIAYYCRFHPNMTGEIDVRPK